MATIVDKDMARPARHRELAEHIRRYVIAHPTDADALELLVATFGLCHAQGKLDGVDEVQKAFARPAA